MNTSRPTDPQVLQVTLRVHGRPVGTRMVEPGNNLLPDTPFTLGAQTQHGGLRVVSPEGTIELRDGEEATLEHSGVEMEVGVIRRRWFARFGWSQSDAILPTIILTVSLFLVQLQFLLSILFPPMAGGADGGMEPSPELIARLLQGQFDGAEKGVVAQKAARPGGDAIENYYLPAGHAGPMNRQSGGKNVGKHIRDGEVNATAESTAPPVVEIGNQLLPMTNEPKKDETQRDEDEGEGEKDADQIAQHITEGWGFTDWYNTEDARKDAKEIQEQLIISKELLKIDPNDPYALSIRGYYEYLAMDYEAARQSYSKFTKLYPSDPAGWNNLALSYKRTGDYKQEEELYRIALRLAPDDDHALTNLAVCLAHQGRFDEALAIMKKLETIIPDDAYADLHRAKIYAAMGEEDRSYSYLQRSLSAMRKLDTLHNIEFRQDIRVDPAFAQMRTEERFEKLLDRYYGDREGGWWKKRGTNP